MKKAHENLMHQNLFLFFVKKKTNMKEVKFSAAKAICQKTKKMLLPARAKSPVVARYDK